MVIIWAPIVNALLFGGAGMTLSEDVEVGTP